MKCEEAGRFLDAYLDNELELSRRIELERHLSLCLSCWSLVLERQKFRAFFRASAPKYKAPPQLRIKVLAAARREKAEADLCAFASALGLCRRSVRPEFVFGLELPFSGRRARGFPPGSIASFPVDLR